MWAFFVELTNPNAVVWPLVGVPAAYLNKSMDNEATEAKSVEGEDLKEEIQREDPVRTWERRAQRRGPGKEKPRA